MSFSYTTTPDEGEDEFEELREQVDHPMLRLVTYARDNRRLVGAGLVVTFLWTLSQLVQPLILAVTIDATFLNARPYTLPLLPSRFVPEAKTGQILLSVLLILVFRAASLALSIGHGGIWKLFSHRVQHGLRVDAYELVQTLEMEFFDAHQTGQVMSLLDDDVSAIEAFLSDALKNSVYVVMMLFWGGAIMVWLNWQLALLAMVAVPLLVYANLLFARLVKQRYRRVRSSVGQLNARLENNVSGIEVIKAYNTEEFESDRVSDASWEYLESRWEAIKTRIKFQPTFRGISTAAYLAVFVVGGLWVVNGPPWIFTTTLSVGTFVAFLRYTQQFMGPLQMVSDINDNYQFARAGCERVFGLFEATRREFVDSEPGSDSAVTGAVAYDGVTFSYPRTDEPAVDDVSFAVDAGTTVGIVGPTGAGKTTMMKLLLRLYDPDEGAIRIDGQPLESHSTDTLRGSTGYVSQDPFLFYGTVRENITYGVDEEVAETAVITAAKRAGAHTFIQNLPDGYDTVIGERGVRLSGGQRQRVSIARALIRQPKILVLDEATSHVDNETEVIIQSSIEDLIADRTTFTIAHRLSTVRNADVILVLEDGELIEQGSHDDLLEEDGLYANLWRVQVGQVDDLPEDFVARTEERRAQIEFDD